MGWGEYSEADPFSIEQVFDMDSILMYSQFKVGLAEAGQIGQMSDFKLDIDFDIFDIGMLTSYFISS